MSVSAEERRQIENEMIFRRANELVRKDDLLLEFKCECSDEKCDARIPMRLSVYRQIHLNRSSFIIKLRHQVEAIEQVVLSEANYAVVTKNNSVPEPGDDLNFTSLNNFLK